MHIISENCIGCELCVAYCPVEAIEIINKKAEVDKDLCTECNACIRSGACKFDAMKADDLKWPRLIRSLLSDVFTEYEGVAGRGTEEMKTNDITNRFKKGFSGVAIELGRPNVSTTFRDVQTIATAVAKHDIMWEPKNPCNNYIVNKETGKVQEDIIDERVISAIIEILVKNEDLESLLQSIVEAGKHIDTVFSLDVACRVEEDNTIPAKDILEKSGIFFRPNCKTNVGLGKIK